MADCGKCGQPLKDGSSYCAQCGAAVKYCPKCGHVVKDGARFCAECGTAVGESSPDPQVPTYPAAPAAAAVPVSSAAPGAPAIPFPSPANTAWVNFTVVDYGGLFGEVTNTIVIDGVEVRTIQVGENAVFQVAPGAHTIQLVQVFRSVATLKMGINRKSNLLQFSVAPGAQAVIAAEYGFILGKFSLSLK